MTTSTFRAKGTTSTMEIGRLTFDRMVVGKTYMFGEHKGKLIAKHEGGDRKSATGWGSCIPMITIRWK